jgi:regulator of protease activity HflC (stomatin/prohibitin superfamily)
MNDLGKLIRNGLIGFILLIAFVSSATIVGAGKQAVVTRLGEVKGTLDSGFHWIIPFTDTAHIMDIQEQKEEVEVSSASSDLQTVNTRVALNYHLQADKINDLYREVGVKYKVKVIDPAIQESMKAATAKFTAEQLITKREEVKEVARANLTNRLIERYIVVDDLSIINFDFSPEFNKAVEAKVTAEQQALASKNKLEQVKYEAEQRTTQAKAEAEAIRIQAEAIQSQGGASYVNLKAIEKWNGTLPQYSLGSSTPFIQIPN